MLGQDEFRRVGEEWSAMSPSQQHEVRERLEIVRRQAKARGPFSVATLRSWQEMSGSICEESATWLWPTQFAPGVEAAFECAILERLLSAPEVMAWEALNRHLQAALGDPAIKSEPTVRGMVEDVLGVIEDNADWAQTDGEPPLWGFLSHHEAAKQARSFNARMAARSKNAIPRAWVVSEWNDRTDRGQSKASFGKQYASLVKARFDVDVTPEQIYRAWLPKG